MAKRTALIAVAFCFGVFAQTPTLSSVSNAASYASAIAPGSIFVAFGSNMGPATLTQASALPLETTLAGTSVRFTPAGGGAAIQAYMVYTSAGQLAGILPSTAAAGNYNVTVTANGATSAASSVTVRTRAYGMITVNSRGSGLAVMQNASQGNAVNLFTAPARPGDTLVLWGTGLGPVTVPDNAAPGVQDLRGQVNIRVVVGGVEIAPVYAGRSPSLPGADQINFTLPASVATGCTVALEVRVGDTSSQLGSISIAPPGRAICQHPFLSDDAIRRIESGSGNTTIGFFSLGSYTSSISIPGLPLPSIEVKSESVSGSFERLSLGNLADFSTDLAPPVGSCYVTRLRQDASGQEVPTGVSVGLDAGGINLNGPAVSNRALNKLEGNRYSLVLAAANSLPGLPGGGPTFPGISAGTYTLTGAGGADVGPFTASVQVAARPNWTNRDAITRVVRSQPLTVNWTGSGAGDIVLISGFAAVQAAGSTTDNPVFEGTSFVCIAPGTANSFTVPVSILQQLPAARGIDFTTGNFDSIGILSVSSNNGNSDNGKFTAPLRAGGNVDIAFFLYSFGFTKNLPYE